MKKILTGLTLAMAVGTVQAVELSGTVTLTSDYRFRGLSQTSGDPSLQASLDIAFDNGVFAGVWGSNVDWGDDADVEIDYYVGYGADINDDLSYDIILNYYTYPGYDSDDIDYAEIIAGLYYGDFTFTYAYSNDYVNAGEDGSYIAVDYSFPINDSVNLDLHAGHSFGDIWDGYGYEDYAIGISGSAANLDLSLAYLTNSVDIAETDDFDDDTVLLTVSRGF